MSYGEIVPGVEIDILLRAIADVETGGGRNNWPRLERSYIPVGQGFTIQGHVVQGTGTNVNPIVRARWAKWGLGSAASWGPWQILYHTAADLAYSGPPHLLFDPGTCEPFVVGQLRKIASRGATTVGQFADAWNSGSFKDANVPGDYIAQVAAAYERFRGAAQA